MPTGLSSAAPVLSPLDGRYAQITAPLTEFCTEAALIKRRLKVEVAWLRTLLTLPAFESKKSVAAESQLAALNAMPIAEIVTGVATIEQNTRHDVKAVEIWLGNYLNKSGLSDLVPLIHFGCTSWDINNLAYALMLSEARNSVLLPELDALIEELQKLSGNYAFEAMLSRTHSQPATPTTLGKEFSVFALRLVRQRKTVANHIFDGKLNGTVGNFNSLMVAMPDVPWESIAHDFVNSLGLRFATHTTQVEPLDGTVEFFDTIARINRILIDLAQDVSLYTGSGHLVLPAKTAEVGSSTMPHKVNPIDFENAEGNLAVANALLHMLADKLQVSRLQRDLSNSTVLRNIGAAFGHSLVAWTSARRGLGSLAVNKLSLQVELNANWQVLGEAVQTVLRKTGDAQAYAKIKAATHGNSMDENDYRKLILDLVPAGPEQNLLLKLRPETYLGLAAELAQRGAEQAPSPQDKNKDQQAPK